MQVRSDPDALEAWAVALRALATAVQEHAAAVFVSFDAVANERRWTDDVSVRFRVTLQRRLESTSDAANRLVAIAGLLATPIASLRAYAGERPRPSAAQETRSLAEPRPVVSSRGRPLRFIGLGRLREELAWEPGEDHVLASEPHHGNSPADYLELARTLPAVLGRPRATLVDGSVEARAWDAFLGNDPIRIEARPDGRLSIVDGRHRLFACLRAGVAPPVDIVEHQR